MTDTRSVTSVLLTVSIGFVAIIVSMTIPEIERFFLNEALLCEHDGRWTGHRCVCPLVFEDVTRGDAYRCETCQCANGGSCEALVEETAGDLNVFGFLETHWVCDCAQGDSRWYGPRCEQCNARHFSPANGTCDGPCNATWYGPRCQVHCDPAIECNGHGHCDAAGQCVCDADWFPVDNEPLQQCNLTCPGALSPNGTCALSEWTAWSSCSHHPCASSGVQLRFRTLTGPGLACNASAMRQQRPCVCDPAKPPSSCVVSEWTPWSNCSATDPAATGLETRSRMPVDAPAIASSDCASTTTWFEQRACFGRPWNVTCSGHGTCTEGGLCDCDPGYFAPTCSTDCPTNDGRVCNGEGTCTRQTLRCQCNADRNGRPIAYGPACERPCPLDRGLVCGGHGECVDDGTRATCECASPFEGEACACSAQGSCSGHGVCLPDSSCNCTRDPTAGYWQGPRCAACVPNFGPLGSCAVFCDATTCGGEFIDGLARGTCTFEAADDPCTCASSHLNASVVGSLAQTATGTFSVETPVGEDDYAWVNLSTLGVPRYVLPLDAFTLSRDGAPIDPGLIKPFLRQGGLPTGRVVFDWGLTVYFKTIATTTARIRVDYRVPEHCATCASTWFPPDCERRCDALTTCHGNGECAADGTCACDSPHFDSDTCETCLSQRAGNGDQANWTWWPPCVGDGLHCAAAERPCSKLCVSTATDLAECYDELEKQDPNSVLRTSPCVRPPPPPPPPDEPCVVSAWGPYRCEALCVPGVFSRGVATRNRTLLRTGTRCAALSLFQRTESFAPCDCRNGTAPNAALGLRNATGEARCVVGPWGEWTPCSVRCGLGYRFRNRTVVQRTTHQSTHPCRLVPLFERAPCPFENCTLRDRLAVWLDHTNASAAATCARVDVHHWPAATLPSCFTKDPNPSLLDGSRVLRSRRGPTEVLRFELDSLTEYNQPSGTRIAVLPIESGVAGAIRVESLHGGAFIGANGTRTFSRFRPFVWTPASTGGADAPPEGVFFREYYDGATDRAYPLFGQWVRLALDASAGTIELWHHTGNGRAANRFGFSLTWNGTAMGLGAPRFDPQWVDASLPFQKIVLDGVAYYNASCQAVESLGAGFMNLSHAEGVACTFCSGHGHCMPDGQCECDTFTDEADNALIPGSPDWFEAQRRNALRRIASGFYGPRCQNTCGLNRTSDEECSGHGRCIYDPIRDRSTCRCDPQPAEVGFEQGLEAFARCPFNVSAVLRANNCTRAVKPPAADGPQFFGPQCQFTCDRPNQTASGVTCNNNPCAAVDEYTFYDGSHERFPVSRRACSSLNDYQDCCGGAACTDEEMIEQEIFCDDDGMCRQTACACPGFIGGTACQLRCPVYIDLTSDSVCGERAAPPRGACCVNAFDPDDPTRCDQYIAEAAPLGLYTANCICNSNQNSLNPPWFDGDNCGFECACANHAFGVCDADENSDCACRASHRYGFLDGAPLYDPTIGDEVVGNGARLFCGDDCGSSCPLGSGTPGSCPDSWLDPETCYRDDRIVCSGRGDCLTSCQCACSTFDASNGVDTVPSPFRGDACQTVCPGADRHFDPAIERDARNAAYTTNRTLIRMYETMTANVCFRHGSCLAAGNCSCIPGYAEPTCEFVCPPWTNLSTPETQTAIATCSGNGACLDRQPATKAICDCFANGDNGFWSTPGNWIAWYDQLDRRIKDLFGTLAQQTPDIALAPKTTSSSAYAKLIQTGPGTAPNATRIRQMTTDPTWNLGGTCAVCDPSHGIDSRCALQCLGSIDPRVPCNGKGVCLNNASCHCLEQFDPSTGCATCLNEARFGPECTDCNLEIAKAVGSDCILCPGVVVVDASATGKTRLPCGGMGTCELTPDGKGTECECTGDFACHPNPVCTGCADGALHVPELLTCVACTEACGPDPSICGWTPTNATRCEIGETDLYCPLEPCPFCVGRCTCVQTPACKDHCETVRFETCAEALEEWAAWVRAGADPEALVGYSQPARFDESVPCPQNFSRVDAQDPVFAALLGEVAPSGWDAASQTHRPILAVCVCPGYRIASSVFLELPCANPGWLFVPDGFDANSSSFYNQTLAQCEARCLADSECQAYLVDDGSPPTCALYPRPNAYTATSAAFTCDTTSSRDRGNVRRFSAMFPVIVDDETATLATSSSNSPVDFVETPCDRPGWDFLDSSDTGQRTIEGVDDEAACASLCQQPFSRCQAYLMDADGQCYHYDPPEAIPNATFHCEPTQFFTGRVKRFSTSFPTIWDVDRQRRIDNTLEATPPRAVREWTPDPVTWPPPIANAGLIEARIQAACPACLNNCLCARADQCQYLCGTSAKGVPNEVPMAACPQCQTHCACMGSMDQCISHCGTPQTGGLHPSMLGVCRFDAGTPALERLNECTNAEEPLQTQCRNLNQCIGSCARCTSACFCKLAKDCTSTCGAFSYMSAVSPLFLYDNDLPDCRQNCASVGDCSRCDGNGQPLPSCIGPNVFNASQWFAADLPLVAKPATCLVKSGRQGQSVPNELNTGPGMQCFDAAAYARAWVKEPLFDHVIPDPHCCQVPQTFGVEAIPNCNLARAPSAPLTARRRLAVGGLEAVIPSETSDESCAAVDRAYTEAGTVPTGTGVFRPACLCREYNASGDATRAFGKLADPVQCPPTDAKWQAVFYPNATGGVLPTTGTPVVVEGANFKQMCSASLTTYSQTASLVNGTFVGAFCEGRVALNILTPDEPLTCPLSPPVPPTFSPCATCRAGGQIYNTPSPSPSSTGAFGCECDRGRFPSSAAVLETLILEPDRTANFCARTTPCTSLTSTDCQCGINSTVMWSTTDPRYTFPAERQECESKDAVRSCEVNGTTYFLLGLDNPDRRAPYREPIITLVDLCVANTYTVMYALTGTHNASIYFTQPNVDLVALL